MKIKANCSYCNRVIMKWPYELKLNKSVFCDKICYDKSQSTRPILKCSSCQIKTNKFRKYCDRCLSVFKRKQALSIASLGGKTRWKGHEYNYQVNGYLMSKVKEHPFANNRGYVYKHRLEMEKHLGRKLSPIEVVHHKDGDKKNNIISNLVLFKTTNEHTRYHALRGDLK